MYEQSPKAGIQLIVPIVGDIIVLLLFVPEIPPNWKILLIVILINEATLVIVNLPRLIAKFSIGG